LFKKLKQLTSNVIVRVNDRDGGFVT